MPLSLRILLIVVGAALIAPAVFTAPACGRTAALSGSWSALQSDLLDWPSDQLGFNGYIGPFSENFYLVPGLTGARDSRADITSTGVSLSLHYMLPAGDRFVPFIEGGILGQAFRVDVIDRTGDGLPTFDRTTYVRGGFQLGAGIDLALGGNWSVVAAIRGVFLDDLDTEFVSRDGRVLTLSRDPSYWELPRIAIVYWY